MSTFCLIHGKWHDGSCWEPLAELLRAGGHQVVAPDIPQDDPAVGYEERLAGVRAPSPPDAVVVAHSLGAMYAPLVPASRRIYLCPAPAGPLAGAAPDPVQPGFPFPPDRDDKTSVWEPAAAVAAMYPRLEPGLAEELAHGLHPAGHPVEPYPAIEPQTGATLILALHDEFFRPEWSRAAARAAFGTEALELDAGHFPMLECPEALAELLAR